MKVAIAEVESAVRDALGRLGYDAAEIEEISTVLLYAQLRDNNQGIAKLLGAGMPKHPDAGEIAVVHETPLSAVLDGAQRPGIVVANRAMRLAVAKADDTGFGIVGVRNTSSSTGAIGYYAREVAGAGHIGIVLSGSPGMVAPHGSHAPLFGTNPIAFGIPSDGSPIVFDTATSAMAYYGLIEAATAGDLIPDDVAFDEDGSPTTDPGRALRGALRPFDRGPRGSGFSLVFEVLTGPLVGAAFAGIGDTATNWGHLVMAIDPGLLGDRHEFGVGVTRLVDQVHRAPRLSGVDAVLVPGERGDMASRQRVGAGEIDIEENLYRGLLEAAGRL